MAQQNKPFSEEFEKKLSPLFELIYVLIKNTNKYVEVYATDVKVDNLEEYKKIKQKLQELEDAFAQLYWGTTTSEANKGLTEMNSVLSQSQNAVNSQSVQRAGQGNTTVKTSVSNNSSGNVGAQNNTKPMGSFVANVHNPIQVGSASVGANPVMTNQVNRPSNTPTNVGVNTQYTSQTGVRGSMQAQSQPQPKADVNKILQNLEKLRTKTFETKKNLNAEANTNMNSMSQNNVSNSQPSVNQADNGVIQIQNRPIPNQPTSSQAVKDVQPSTPAQVSLNTTVNTTSQNKVQPQATPSVQAQSSPTITASNTVGSSSIGSNNVPNNANTTTTKSTTQSMDEDAELQKILEELRKMKK